jgi:ribosome-associated toxin RatA of RatAB toxin-antitoxin module
MNTIKFAEKITIATEPLVAFDFTQDYANRLVWDTFLRQAVLVEGATSAALGVKAYCVAKNGLGMETEYVSFNRPKVTAVKMTKGPFLFSSFLGSWNFKELATGTTEVTFLYSFGLRFPFNLVAPLVRLNLQRNVRQRLRDLKCCLEQQAHS